MNISAPNSVANEDLSFLEGGGEMGALIRAHDWSESSIGLPNRWPQPLRTAVRLILNSGHPMYIWWGPKLLCLYNDAYRASIGKERHPSSLGKPARQVWAEIWPIIGPQIEAVMTGQGATWQVDQLVPITRHGKVEDVYWTYSYSPLDDMDASNRVGGVLVICSETTATVLAAKAREQELVRQREMFSQAPGFMIVMSGPEHKVEFVNVSHRRLFGSDSWVGKPIREAFPAIAGQGFFELLDRVFATGEPFRSGATTVKFRSPISPEMETHVLDFIYTPTYDHERTITGVFCEGFDVTQQIDAEKGLRQKEEQLRLATEAADIGLWDVDLVEDKLFWPTRVKAMFGIAADDDVTMTDFYAGLHPDDLQQATEAFEAAIDPLRRELYDVEFRTIGKRDGLTRWLAAKGRGIFSAEGTCTRVIGTAIDITQRRIVEESLRLGEERLKQLDRRKDEFLAILAHELRNPLAPIAHAAGLLQHPSIKPDQVTRYAQMIDRQSRAMAVLLDDLLEVSRISTGKLKLKKTIVSVASLVENALEPVRTAIDAKDHSLRIDMDRGHALLEVDVIRASQVLTNLLTNAVKYSNPGGDIVLRTRATADAITMEVEDTGIGISTEQLRTIFDMFMQAATALDRSEGGLGIGLAVAKALVEMHGGHLEAFSRGLGTGSKFTVTLPRGDVPAISPESDGKRDQPNAALKPQPIMIVDDNVDAAESLAALFEFEGYEVHVPHDGHRALEVAQTVHPVACFLDIGMPGMNGYELAKRLKSLPFGENLFLVATTGWGRPDDRQRSRQAGFDLHLTKPIDVSQAVTALGKRSSN